MKDGERESVARVCWHGAGQAWWGGWVGDASLVHDGMSSWAAWGGRRSAGFARLTSALSDMGVMLVALVWPGQGTAGVRHDVKGTLDMYTPYVHVPVLYSPPPPIAKGCFLPAA